MRRYALALALLLLLVACGPIVLPPIVIPPFPLPSPIVTPPPSPPVNVCASVDACDCFVQIASGWQYRPCTAPSPPASPSPVPSPSATPTPQPTPTPTPAPCTETRTRPSLGPITPTYQGQTGPTYVSLGTFRKGGIGRKDVWYEVYVQEHDATKVCQTPDDHFETGRRMGNWTCPESKAFPGTNVRPHDNARAPNVCITNPQGAGRFVDRDMNKTDQFGNIEIRASLWGFEGDTCPVALPEVVTRTCPPTPGPTPTPGPSPSPTPIPSGAPPLDETGNYPRPERGTCPPWFRDSLTRVGISLLNRRPCFVGGGGGTCEVLNFSATPKSVKPYCGHSCWNEAGVFNPAFCRNECEQWQPGGTPGSCQYPATGLVDSPPGMFIAHPDWGNRWDICDKRSAPEGSPGCRPDADCRQAFICHDRAENRSGVTKAMACPQGVSPPATSDGPVPPGCSTTQVQH